MKTATTTIEKRLPNRQQGGFIIILVSALLVALLILSMQFFDRSLLSMRSADLNRSSNESLLLAESAVNWLYSSFINNRGTTDVQINNQSIVTVTNPNLSENGFMFYINQNNAQPPEIRIGQPDILQRIADGEARRATGNVSKQIIDSASSRLMVRDLLKQGTPVKFARIDGRIDINMSLNWETSNHPRAAAWIELVRDVNQPNQILLYAQGVGRFENSQSYVQRLVGHFDDTMGPGLWAFTQAGLK